MGQLVPPDFPLNTLDDTERRVVELLRDGLPDGWLILPDVAVQTHRDHQLDIVVVHESWGIVDLEVKGHRMQLRSGAWYAEGSRLGTQPMKQASDNAYALRSRLRARGGDLAHVDVAYGVALPNTISIEGDLGEVDRRQVLTAVELEDPQPAVEALASSRSRQVLSEAAVGTILATLRPDADLTWDPEARARQARNRLDELCSIQVAALETLDANRRVFVTGRAGTGKTRLAARWAQRAWTDGQRVLLTCYNDPLADDLRRRIAHDDDLVIGSFLRTALALDGMPPLPIPDDADHEWWNADAVAHLLRHWHEVTPRFGTVIVDEGQDFHPAWLALLVQLLEPDGPRRLLVVADDAQDIYHRGFRPPSADEGWTVAELVNNCRNVHPIARLLRRHLDGAKAPQIGPEGLGPDWLPAHDLATVTRVVNDLLVELQEHDERDPAGIVVATLTSSVRDHLRAELGLGRWEDRAEGRVACENVHRIKGLETDTVVLATPSAEVADPLLYIGVSRAVSQLVLVSPEPLAQRLGLARARR